MRRSFKLRIYGYVVMPQHVHLLVSEPERGLLADALKSLKQGVSRCLVAGAPSGGTLKSGSPLIALYRRPLTRVERRTIVRSS